MMKIKALSAVLLVISASLVAQVPAKPKRQAAPARHSIQHSVVYYGAVDLGSKGSKAALYSFITDDEGTTPDLLFSENINTTLVSSMADGKFTKDGIDDATKAVSRLVNDMKDAATKNNIDVQLFYVVGSSGVAKASNKQDLVKSVRAATGIDMDFIDAAHEGYYGLLSAVPRSRRLSAMYVDVGSGNTKIGCLTTSESFDDYKSYEIPYGSVSGRNEALKRSPDDIMAGLDSLMKDVGAAYTKGSFNFPCLRNRKFVYWSGGAGWATASYTHPERALRGYVPVSRIDVRMFLTTLQNDTWRTDKPKFVFAAKTPADKQAAIRTQALKDRAEVQTVFVREDLLSGVSIINTVLSSSNPTSLVQFVRYGNYIYGYALEKYKKDSAGSQ